MTYIAHLGNFETLHSQQWPVMQSDLKQSQNSSLRLNKEDKSAGQRQSWCNAEQSI